MLVPSLETLTLKSILNSQGVSLILRNPKGVIIGWSKGAEKMFGHTETEALGKDLTLLTPQANFPTELLKYMNASSSPESAVIFYTKRRHKNGNEMDVIIVITTILNEFNSIVGFTEIVSENRPEAILSEEFRITLENSPIGKVMIDSNGRIVFVNKVIEKIFLYSKEELIGQKIEIFLPQRLKAILENFRLEFVKNPQPEQMGRAQEFYGIRKDEKEVPVEIGLITFSTSQGNFIVATFLDISERKMLEGAVKSNKELEQFAYIASHDLQAPLRHIASYIEALAKKNENFHDKESKHWIETVLKGVRRMKSLILDLLKFSRINQSSPVFKSVNPKDILDEILEVLRESIKNSGATITYELVPEIISMPRLFGELLQNLLENAIKFQKNNVPPKIHISIKSEQEVWLFSVKDNGIGIKPQYKERIFIPFQRLHRQDEKAGNGIGLAIVKKIIEMHNGKIWLESELGIGCNFMFTFPKTVEKKLVMT